MLDSDRLRTELEQAASQFAEEIVKLVRPHLPALAAKTASKPAPLSPTPHELRQKLLQLAALHPDGATADQLASDAAAGLAPVFAQLRYLVKHNLLDRRVLGDDQLPVYVLASEPPQEPQEQPEEPPETKTDSSPEPTEETSS